MFSHIYLDNLRPANLAGYRVKAAKNALAVDNFFADFFFIEIDLPPTSRTNVKFVKSVTMENDGHEEEQI